MRLVYRGRRDALLAGFARWHPEIRPTGASAGLHVQAVLPHGVGEGGLVRAAAGKEIALSGARETYAGVPADPGLVFGYSSVDERHITAGLERLASLSARPGPRRAGVRRGRW